MYARRMVPKYNPSLPKNKRVALAGDGAPPLPGPRGVKTNMRDGNFLKNCKNE